MRPSGASSWRLKRKHWGAAASPALPAPPASCATIHAARHEQALPRATRVRRSGGGRKKTRDRDPTLVADLEALVSPDTRGDPMSPLRWTCKSTHQLANALQQRGHQVSEHLVRTLLHAAHYSLQ